MSIVDLLIVGAGPVGMYASILAKMRGIKVLVWEKTATFGGQLNLYPQKDIYDIAGVKQIKALDLAKNLYQQTLDYQVEVSFNRNIVNFLEVVEDEHNYYKVIGVNLSDNQEEVILAKCLLLTTGEGIYDPITLDIANLSRKHVLYKVENPYVLENKDVVVLGGGDSAVDIANMLAPLARVTLVHRRVDFRAKEENVQKFILNHGQIYKPFNLKDVVEVEDKLYITL
ncbi:MAG: NAD(P)/FAD-dependent oxidoreductase, partial [Acholeplasmatales bacterium]|nr:NAD(P)/FAD-dependent oxidoreductase [Acholeplasmatales bacterium]